MTYKFDIWYKAELKDLDFLDTIEVDAHSEKDAEVLVSRIVASHLQIVYKPKMKSIDIGKTFL